jgi:hypothetical protein
VTIEVVRETVFHDPKRLGIKPTTLASRLKAIGIRRPRD